MFGSDNFNSSYWVRGNGVKTMFYCLGGTLYRVWFGKPGCGKFIIACMRTWMRFTVDTLLVLVGYGLLGAYARYNRADIRVWNIVRYWALGCYAGGRAGRLGTVPSIMVKFGFTIAVVDYIYYFPMTYEVWWSLFEDSGKLTGVLMSMSPINALLSSCQPSQ